MERFFGVLLEHYGGALPTWLAPTQARVLPVRSDHHDYAEQVVTALRGAGFRADWIEADEPLGARVRKAKMDKVPYVLVVGDEDVAATSLGVNPRGGQVEKGVALSEFLERLDQETADSSAPAGPHGRSGLPAAPG